MNWKLLTLIVLGLLAVGIASRVIPHAPNMTALVAISITASLYLEKKWSLILPFAILLISDPFIGIYDWRIMASVYGSFAVIGIMSWITQKYRGVFPVFSLIIGSSLAFFLITNGAVWLFSPWYEKNLGGLLYAYELGLPFLRNMMMGDIMYSIVLLGLFETGILFVTYQKQILAYLCQKKNLSYDLESQ